MDVIQEARKIRTEQPHSINIEKNVLRMLKPIVSEKTQQFLKRYNNTFEEKVNPKILAEIEDIRKTVMQLLDQKCSEIIYQFENNYEKFCFDHGWYSNLGLRVRHKITKDELAYELCEIIRKLYFVFMEEQFPKQYRAKTVEKYLLRDN